ncbi:MAG: fibronectin type III domain-containing protein [bacterium]|nr:fibronectin type III domain-containing protein [bacterium]
MTLITVTPITTTGATINFTTDRIGNARVEYGTTAGYGETTILDTNLALTHAVTLSNLTPNTLYHYRIITSDEVGNETITSDEEFTTEPLATEVHVITQGDVIISTASTISTISVSASTATIGWHTDIAADSQVEYGNSENLGSFSILDTTLVNSHSVTLSGLTPNTNYIFRVRSKPAGATVANVSANYEFDTLNYSVPVVAPANIISVSSSSVMSTEATITWTTDKGATSQVQYGISSGYGVLTAESTTLATSHSVSLTNLERETTYHFRVKSTDEASNITFSEDYTFTTPASPELQRGESATSSNNIANNVGGSSIPRAITTLTIGGEDATSVELEWHVGTTDTDITAQYDVRYNTSPIDASNFAQAISAQIAPIYYGDVSPVGTERAYIVAGLNPNTTYYFAVESKHENSAYSGISNVVSVRTTGGASINNIHNQNQDSVLEVSTSVGQLIVSSGYGSGSGGTGRGSFEPTLIKAESVDKQIVFEWNNPGEANFVRTVVVRKEGSYPTSPTDGQTIYEGRGDTYADTELQNGKTYYYTVYSYNHAKTYSKGVNVSLAPNAGNTQVKFNESGTLASSTPVFHFVKTWQKGDRDIEIEHLQELLVADKDSYPEKYVTGYFGSLTEAALKRFQAKHGLSQTGNIDVATQQKLNTVSQSETKLNIPHDFVVFGTDLKRGDESQAVKDLQQYLIYEGSYVEAIVSGYFGNLTHNAVKTFQAKYGIDPVLGIVGPKTRHKMQDLVGL